ncbi:MAG: thioesterase family protein [Rickettsiales bacterium]|nr:thioesterase family protein [Rickettsiales bacterium]
MKNTLTTGLTHTASMIVTERELVPQVYPDHAVFSSLPDVYATAFMVGFAEATCAELLHQHLEAGESSVGVHVNLSHNAPTPKGLEVQAQIEVLEIEKRRVRFSVTLRDDTEIISTGTHDRFVIDAERFGEKIAQKRQAESCRA